MCDADMLRRVCRYCSQVSGEKRLISGANDLSQLLSRPNGGRRDGATQICLRRGENKVRINHIVWSIFDFEYCRYALHQRDPQTPPTLCRSRARMARISLSIATACGVFRAPQLEQARGLGTARAAVVARHVDRDVANPMQPCPRLCARGRDREFPTFRGWRAPLCP